MSANRNYYHDADLYPDPETHDNGEYAYEPPRALLTTQTRGGDPIALPAWLEQDDYLWDAPDDADDATWDALLADERARGGTVVAVRPTIGRARSLVGWLCVALLALVASALMSVPAELGAADDVMFWLICGALAVFAGRGVRRVARR